MAIPLTSRTALPAISRGGAHFDECVSVHAVHQGPLASIVNWQCLRNGEALRAERSHHTYVLTLLARGACRVRDGRWQATIDPLTALLHQPHTSYRTEHPFGCIDAGWNIAYQSEAVEEILARSPRFRRNWPRPSMAVTARAAATGVSQLVHMQRAWQGEAGESIALEELALEILQSVVTSEPVWGRNPGPATSTSEDHRRLAEATREHLNAHFAEPLQLREVAVSVGASPAHLCRVFRSCTGLTMRGYLHRLRLAEALYSATTTGSKLDRVALEAGFFSHSHFSSMCRRILDTSPRQVREWASTPRSAAVH